MERKFDKKVLFKIITDFNNKTIKIDDFCDLYFEYYDLIVDYDKLNEKEEKILSGLSYTVSLYSPFEEDFKHYKFTTEEEIREAVIKAINELKIWL